MCLCIQTVSKCLTKIILLRVLFLGRTSSQRDGHGSSVQPAGTDRTLGDPGGENATGKGKGHLQLHPGELEIM